MVFGFEKFSKTVIAHPDNRNSFCKQLRIRSALAEWFHESSPLRRDRALCKLYLCRRRFKGTAPYCSSLHSFQF